MTPLILLTTDLNYCHSAYMSRIYYSIASQQCVSSPSEKAFNLITLQLRYRVNFSQREPSNQYRHSDVDNKARFLMSSSDTTKIDGSALLMQPDREKQLVEQARAGNESAFAELIDAHSDKIIRLAWRLIGNRSEAEEISQEAFIRFYKSIATFRGDSSVGTWLYRTTSRLAIDYLRREKLKRKLFFFRGDNDEQADPVDQAVDPAASPQDLLQAQETVHHIQQVLNRLPARQKTVFILRHQEGLALKEIAELLELREGTVKTHLHRAISMLRNELGETKETLS
jgi:RNA polymerase sigma-70 factor (ECF subfamily)